jgi:dipeptidase E
VARILAIGGGEIGRLETLELDAEVVRMAAVKRPRVLFVPTATADDPGYVAIVEEHYGARLGCVVEALLVYDRNVTERDIRRAIESADIVYVGGGNTLRMMRYWRRRGVDAALRRAAAAGTVVTGISAGAICWFSLGVSDSRSFAATDESWNYIAVRGLGLVDVALCPHFDADPRRRTYSASMARRRGVPVLGLDDCSALQVLDGRWRILSSREGSVAHRVDPSGTVHDLAPGPPFRTLPDLVTVEV